MIPSGRTTEFAIWKACERLNILPPDVEPRWEDNTTYVQSLLIAYSQIRDIEEAKMATGV